jgi:hypothetical protein
METPHRSQVQRSSPQRFEEVLTRMRDPVFRQKMSERMWKSEGIFAEPKQNHGLSRARYRGRAKVQIQAYLSATAQNLKRLVKAIVRWLLIWLSNRRSSTTQLAHVANMRTFSTRPTLLADSVRASETHAFCKRPSNPYLSGRVVLGVETSHSWETRYGTATERP